MSLDKSTKWSRLRNLFHALAVSKESTQKAITEKSVVHEGLIFDDPDVCRGVQSSSIFRRCGSIFQNSEGSASTYKLSAPREQIDFFISHNWSTSRIQKYLTLIWFENSASALCASYVVCFFVLALGLLGCLPLDLGWALWLPCGLEPLHCSSFYCTVLATIVFNLGVFQGHKMRKLCGIERIAFLDKACIHQTDKDLQRKGIEKLGAFLSVSSSMVALLADSYFNKLWTVYEFATYAIYHTKSGTKTPNIHLLPTRLHSLFAPVIGCLSTIVAYAVLVFLNQLFPASGQIPEPIFHAHLLWVLLVVVGPFNMLVAIVGMQERAENERILQSFSVHNANCSVEADRALVNQNIAVFMDHAGFVRQGSSSTARGRLDALEAFDFMVREEGPRMLLAHSGQLLVGASDMSATSLCIVFAGVDLAIDRHVRGASSEYVLGILLYALFVHLIYHEMNFLTSDMAKALVAVHGSRCTILLLGGAAMVLITYSIQIALAACLHKLLQVAILREPMVWMLAVSYVLLYCARVSFRYLQNARQILQPDLSRFLCMMPECSLADAEQPPPKHAEVDVLPAELSGVLPASACD